MSLTVLTVYLADQEPLKRLRVHDRGLGQRAEAAVLIRSLRVCPLEASCKKLLNCLGGADSKQKGWIHFESSLYRIDDLVKCY